MMSMFFQFVAAVVGAIGFSIIFNAPARQYLLCGLTGGVAWVAYLLIISVMNSPGVASFVATFIIALMSRAFSVVRKTPTSVFITAGIFPIVPGAGIYYTAYYFIMGDYGMAGGKGVETLKIAGAIALGILFGFSVPQRFFIWLGRVTEKQKPTAM